MAKILFLGDLVGRQARRAIIEHLPRIRQEGAYDAVVINAENAAGGSGLTAAIAHDLFAAGADVLTLGDHVWDQRDFALQLPALENVCRPANLPEACPGRGWCVRTLASGFRLGVLALLGRQYLNLKADCPFLWCQKHFEEIRPQADAWVVELHAEATSEKVALGFYLDGKAALVVGTHTHVQTADAQILPKGTAYLTDAGMCGPHDSVIGRDKDIVIARFLDGMPRKLPVAEHKVELHGVSVETDPQTRLARTCTLFSCPIAEG